MDVFAVLSLLLAALAAVFALLAWRKPGAAAPDLSGVLARIEAVDRSVREELARERQSASTEGRAAREELASNLQRTADALLQQLTELRTTQSEAARLDREALAKNFAAIQTTVEQRLEQIRQTVDEKLQGTLEKRLGDSFKLVSERLEQVHKGLGEMQTLASGVGDLKKVLTNVKVRGTWGEVQLGNLLEQMLAPEQFARNVAVTGRTERVEFAIRMPEEDGTVWLPIDAKFPLEDYERLVAAAEAGDAAAVEDAACQLEKRLKTCARDICAKYIAPPSTTDFAVLFLPNEGLYAEVLRRPGLADALLRDCKVHLTGPTTLCALLTSLRYSFQRVAMHRKSAEVWSVLGAAKTEFNKYAEVLNAVKKKLEEASNTVDKAQVRTRAIQKSLRDVESLPAAEDELVSDERLFFEHTT